MPKLLDRVPRYRLHRHSGQAIVTLGGIDHYLGPHGTDVSKTEYDRLVCEWLARGRRTAVPAAEATPEKTVNAIIMMFWEYAQTYYRRPDGTPTTEVDCFRQAIRPLRQLYGRTSALTFGPNALKAIRERMISLKWSRKSINRQIGRLRYIFKWAASQEILPASIFEQIRTLDPLKKGRTAARETPRVKPVADELIHAIKPFVSRQVWAMIQLQLLTAARPGEIVILRGIDLMTQNNIWTANPEEHKTSYRELSKTIYFGPQAKQVLQEYLRERPLDAYLFSPKEAEAERRTKRHMERKTALSCGNRPGTNCATEPNRYPHDHYTVDSYRQAIERGCEQAFSPPSHLARHHIPAKRGKRWESKTEWKTRLGAEGWLELQAWQKSHRWHPHQLRHNAGTYIRREFGLDVARAILGHRSVSVTEIYAEQDLAKAMEAMSKIG